MKPPRKPTHPSSSRANANGPRRPVSGRNGDGPAPRDSDKREGASSSRKSEGARVAASWGVAPDRREKGKRPNQGAAPARSSSRYGDDRKTEARNDGSAGRPRLGVREDRGGRAAGNGERSTRYGATRNDRTGGTDDRRAPARGPAGYGRTSRDSEKPYRDRGPDRDRTERRDGYGALRDRGSEESFSSPARGNGAGRPAYSRDRRDDYRRDERGDGRYARRSASPYGRASAPRDTASEPRPPRMPRTSEKAPRTPLRPKAAGEPQRIAKLLARAGVASRREIERMIEEGRIALNGTVIDTPATLLPNIRGVTVDGQPVAAAEAPRLFLFHKPSGYLTTERDPAGRPTIYDRLPADLPRLMPIGRLDMTTEGLLLLTNDGELKRYLELPANGVERTYRARAFGDISQAQLEELIEGVEIDGIRYGKIDANLERRTGRNQWIEMTLSEGKNREVRRVLEHLGLQVNRLMRVRYGPFDLSDSAPGDLVEIKRGDMDRFLHLLKNESAGGPKE